MGTITIDQAISMFKARIAAYVDPVQKLGLALTQAQFDALVSFCYNVGPQNLANLCRGRSVAQMGEALDIYAQIQRILLTELVHIPIVQPAAYIVVTKRMKNMAVSFTADPAYVIRDAWVDA